jgi:thiamine-phosphate pyrophosphorylase
MSARRLPPPLLAISPGALVHERVEDFTGELARAIEGGLSGLLLREPELSDRAFLELARCARAMLRPPAWLAIHDRVHLAAACGADAVHLGFRSLPPDEARRILEPSIALGFSAHAGDDESARAPSDYLFFGPVLDTPSKRGVKAPVGFTGLAREARTSSIPLWAIGGLKPEHVAAVRASGARGLAVQSGIFAARDVAGACRAYLDALAVE